jgi:glucose-1-phosphate cytidylyltransferase
MKVVILAGGRGTRLAEETVSRPKPMVEIGSRPILWHLMKIYESHGFDEFVVACGYRGELIKEYFSSLLVHSNDYRIDLKDGSRHVVSNGCPDWRVWLIDTGVDTMTGGRLRRLRQWLDDETVLVTYGDGLADVDLGALVRFHRSHGKAATVTAVRPPARFGALTVDAEQRVQRFSEKPQAGEGWINGGFFVFEPWVFDLFTDDQTILERGPLETLARNGELMAYPHNGFWQPMDTLRDRQHLEELWAAGNPPWKVWQ